MAGSRRQMKLRNLILAPLLPCLIASAQACDNMSWYECGGNTKTIVASVKELAHNPALAAALDSVCEGEAIHTRIYAGHKIKAAKQNRALKAFKKKHHLSKCGHFTPDLPIHTPTPRPTATPTPTPHVSPTPTPD